LYNKKEYRKAKNGVLINNYHPVTTKFAVWYRLSPRQCQTSRLDESFVQGMPKAEYEMHHWQPRII